MSNVTSAIAFTITVNVAVLLPSLRVVEASSLILVTEKSTVRGASFPNKLLLGTIVVNTSTSSPGPLRGLPMKQVVLVVPVLVFCSKGEQVSDSRFV